MSLTLFEEPSGGAVDEFGEFNDGSVFSEDDVLDMDSVFLRL